MTTENDLKLIDNCNRHLNYLRVSITDRCNLQCRYCVPQELIPKLSHTDILTYEEILRVVRVAIRLGISKVRVTGGEPLVRKGVYEFLRELVASEGLKDVSLTTNGVLLHDNLAKIQSAGISRINISLDTLDRVPLRHLQGRLQNLGKAQLAILGQHNHESAGRSRCDRRQWAIFGRVNHAPFPEELHRRTGGRHAQRVQAAAVVNGLDQGAAL